MSNDNCRERVVSGAHETRVSRRIKGHEKRYIIAASGVVKRAQGACCEWWHTRSLLSILERRPGRQIGYLLVDEVHQRPGTARGHRADGHHL